MAEPSFADVFKLMTAMNSFETLLDATTLSPDVCVKLGIHDQFKHLYEKLGKYIHHDGINNLNNQNVSSLVGNERKVLEDLNMKTSSVSLNSNTDGSSEFLNNSVKNMETMKLSQNVCSDIPNATVGNLIDLDINPDIFGSYKLLKSSAEVGQNIPPDLMKETAVLQSIEYNNILKDLLKPKSNNNAFSGNHKANSHQRASSDNLGDKMSGLTETLLNKIQESGACSTSGIKPLLQAGVPFLLEQAGNQPERFGKQSASRRRDPSPQIPQHKNVRGEQKKNTNKSSAPVAAASPQVQSINVHVHMSPSDVPPQAQAGPKRAGVQGRDKNYNPTNENLEKLRTRALEFREEYQLMWKMVKEAEGMNNRRGNFSRIGKQYRCNICNTGSLEFSSCYDVARHVQGGHHLRTLQLACLNLERLRTRALEHREEVQLMWKMVKDVEGVNNSRDNFSKVGNQHRCHVCNTGPIISSCYELVNHAWSVEHLDNLQLAASAKSNVPQSKGNAKDPRNKRDNGKETMRSMYEKNMELLKQKTLSRNEEFTLLRKMVTKCDGEHWRRDNFAKHGDDHYICNVCGIVLNSPSQVMDHFRGSSHRKNLTAEDEIDETWHMAEAEREPECNVM